MIADESSAAVAADTTTVLSAASEPLQSSDSPTATSAPVGSDSDADVDSFVNELDSWCGVFDKWTDVQQLVSLSCLVHRLSPIQLIYSKNQCLTKLARTQPRSLSQLADRMQNAHSDDHIHQLFGEFLREGATTSLLHQFNTLLQLVHFHAGNGKLLQVYNNFQTTLLSRCQKSKPDFMAGLYLGMLHPELAEQLEQFFPQVAKVKTVRPTAIAEVAPFELCHRTLTPLSPEIQDLKHDAHMKPELRIITSEDSDATVSTLTDGSEWLGARDFESLLTSSHARLNRKSSATYPSVRRHEALASTRSEGVTLSQLNDFNTFVEAGSGMRDTPAWLRGLRLHKYTALFQKLTYDEMEAVDDNWLDGRGVVLGARKKILKNISRLKERQARLQEMEKELVEKQANLPLIIDELRELLITPIKSFGKITDADIHYEQSQPLSASLLETVALDDLPTQLTRTISKVMHHLLVYQGADEVQLYGNFARTFDRCILHESFTGPQKKLLSVCRDRLMRIHPNYQFKNRSRLLDRRSSYTYPQPTVIPATSSLPAFQMSDGGPQNVVSAIASTAANYAMKLEAEKTMSQPICSFQERQMLMRHRGGPMVNQALAGIREVVNSEHFIISPSIWSSGW